MIDKDNDYFDDNLALKCRNNNKSAEMVLFGRYNIFIKKWIHEFNNLKFVDIEQLWFMGLCAFYEAIETYDYDKGHFYSFCKICCKRQMMNELRKELKRTSMETYIPAEEMGYLMLEEESDETYLIDDIKKNKNDNFYLTDIEKKVLLLRGQGDKYKEISEKLNVSIKKIDNTIQRIKKRYKEKDAAN